ncbi:unnamed protein product [Trifolium pratense]|uniref:Uncharacterized protein n=1 Tax=Trifolium pratense TaxID=57577 RepID=A0ACB0M4L6_TRIPR|nr:unnamed protein product [Trifolium pratense]
MSTSSPLPPINLINRMWEHFKEHGEMRHPSYGFDAKNVRFALLPTLERFRRLFPNGLIVEKVFEDYNAESAGLQVGDVIFACDGIEIKSLLQLWELMFANVGKEVELEVARVDLKVIKNIGLIIGETSIDEEIYQ